MSENNIEKEEVKEEQLEHEEIVETGAQEVLPEGEETIEASLDDEQETAVSSVAERSRVSFFRSFSANIVDEAIIGIISVALLYALDAILKVSGYFVAQRGSMLLVIFVVISILYISIMEASKSGKTVGKKMLNI